MRSNNGRQWRQEDVHVGAGRQPPQGALEVADVDGARQGARGPRAVGVGAPRDAVGQHSLTGNEERLLAGRVPGCRQTKAAK